MSNLTVSAAPHIRTGASTSRIMTDVLIALVPAFIASIIIFGSRSILVVCVCVATCVFCEWAYEKAMKKQCTVRDMSACLTGVILAFNLPATIPVWQAVFGSAVAIILIKQLFGGLGKNFANPAATARIVMFLAFSTTMTNWPSPVNSFAWVTIDSLSGATPLAMIARGDANLPGLIDMFLGIRGGALGETSVLALLIGGIYLIIRRVITWHTPVIFVATVFVFTALLGRQPVYQVLSGGLILGAIFMATDYVTTPQTSSGRLIFGVGAGLITVLVRIYGSYPEGVSFAILLMNILTPYINKLTMNKPLGGVKP